MPRYQLEINCKEFAETVEKADDYLLKEMRKTVKEILYKVFTESSRKEGLKDAVITVIGAIFQDQNLLSTLEAEKKEKARIEHLLLQAQNKIDELRFERLAMVLSILGNSGLERALDYCLQGQQIRFRRV